MDTLMSQCSARGDEWADRVQARLLAVHDLPATDAMSFILIVVL